MRHTFSIITPSRLFFLLVFWSAASGVADTHYVNAAAQSATPPYTNWATAAVGIQDAVNASEPGDVVLVANGYYVLSQELLVDRAIEIRSVNGARLTTLDAGNAHRCVTMMSSGALLEGFSLIKGTGLSANYILGTLKKCIVRNNYAESANYPWGAIYLGGSARLENCLIYENTARCTSPRDSTRGTAGVFSSGGSLVNCTIMANTLYAGKGGGGFQAAMNKGGLVQNCIIWGNPSPDNIDVGTWSGYPLFSYCCMKSDVMVTEFRTNGPPQFVNYDSGDFRLSDSSPCIDAGVAADWMAGATDLDGGRRALDGNRDGRVIPDIGALEFYPAGFTPLVITASPLPHGVPGPLGYGNHTVATGATVTNRVTPFAEETNGVGYACTGWTGSGSVPASGTGTSVVFTLSQYSTLEWLWKRTRVSGADYGDAPSPYPVTDPQDFEGPWHVALGPMLGVNRDTETNGQPSAAADGDDGNPSGANDEDGLAILSPLRVAGLDSGVTVNVANAPGGARLDAWIDMNADGSWGGPRERVAANLAVTNGANRLRFEVPASSASGTTYARLRLSTAGGLGLSGFALDGEIEDHAVELMPPAVAVGPFDEERRIGNAARSVFGTDLDGDGDMDVLGAMEWDEIAWFENDGTEAFTRHSIWDGSGAAMSVVAADLDGDGRMDVVSAHTPGSGGVGKIVWHRNEGNQVFTESTISARPWGAGCVVVADMDGDGDLDVCSASAPDDTIAWHENNGSQVFTDRIVSTSADGATAVFAADVDRDGDMDLLSASPNDDIVAWYENDGGQAFTRRVISAAADGVSCVVAADLDGDRDLDVLSASANDDAVWWYDNDGSRGFMPRLITTNLDNACSVVAADVDGDGDPDVVASGKHAFSGTGADRIVWFENTPDRSFPEHVVDAAGGGVSLHASDMDRDGDVDVLSSWLQGINTGRLSWHDNTPPVRLWIRSEHGVVSPGTGLFKYENGTVLTNSVEFADVQGTTQYVCAGWVMTGNAPAGGAGPVMTMTLTNEATLAWRWETNYWFDRKASEEGVLEGSTSGWYRAGSAVTVTAVPNAGYTFAGWADAAAETNQWITLTLNGCGSASALYALNVITVLADRASVNVPEGGLAEFQVRLSAQPTGDTAVAVMRSAGDADLTVSGGASLVFSTTNWDVGQAVTLAAAEDDADNSDGSAGIACQSAGHAQATVTANEVDDDFTLTVVSAQGTVTLDPERTYYDNGSDVGLTAAPISNYCFMSWSGGLSGTNNPGLVRMDGDKTVTALYGSTLHAILPPQRISPKSFVARWKWAPYNAPEGELSVASNVQFSLPVPGYESRYVVNGPECPVTNLAANRDYWYRIRHMAPDGSAGPWSSHMKVRTGRGVPIFKNLLGEVPVSKGVTQEFALTNLVAGSGLLKVKSSSPEDVRPVLTADTLRLQYLWRSSVTARITLTLTHPATGYKVSYGADLRRAAGSMAIVEQSPLTNAGVRAAQELTLENRTGEMVYGVRVRALGLDRADWLINRTGLDPVSQAAIREIPCVVPAGAQIKVRLVYNGSYKKQAKTNPVRYGAWAVMASVDVMAPLSGELTIMQQDPYDGLWMLGLPTNRNRRYSVYHSDDGGATWSLNVPVIRATGNHLMWLDLDQSAPAERLYKVMDAGM